MNLSCLTNGKLYKLQKVLVGKIHHQGLVKINCIAINCIHLSQLIDCQPSIKPIHRLQNMQLTAIIDYTFRFDSLYILPTSNLAVFSAWRDLSDNICVRE